MSRAMCALMWFMTAVCVCKWRAGVIHGCVGKILEGPAWGTARGGGGKRRGNPWTEGQEKPWLNTKTSVLLIGLWAQAKVVGHSRNSPGRQRCTQGHNTLSCKHCNRYEWCGECMIIWALKNHIRIYIYTYTYIVCTLKLYLFLWLLSVRQSKKRDQNN